MIALMFLAGAIVWLVVAALLALWIPSRLGMERFGWVVSLVLFPALLVAPITDQLIGNWQFKRLCEREAVIYLSDNWQDVKRAKSIDSGVSKRIGGYIVRIQVADSIYQNVDTKEIFFHYKTIFNYGGFLMDKMGLRLSGAPPSCEPENLYQVWDKINLSHLLQKGKLND